MQIGDPSRFATQFEVNVESAGEWLFGKFCYWISGHRVGRYDEGTSLRDVLFQLPTILRDRDRTAPTSLFALPAEVLLQRLRGALYGRGNAEYDAQAMQEQWARFDLKLPVDILDRCVVFLVESPPLARIVFTTDYDRPVQEATLRAREVDEVLMSTYKELDGLYTQALEHAARQSGR